MATSIGSWDRGLWCIPLLITVHNFEEAVAMKAALPDLNRFVAASPIAAFAPVTHPQFLGALGVVTVAAYLLVALSRFRPSTAAGVRFALLVLQTTMLLNVLFHGVCALLLGGYVPGLVSAVLLNLPFSLWLIHRSLRDGWIRPEALPTLGLLAALLHGPALIALLYGAGAVLRAAA